MPRIKGILFDLGDTLLDFGRVDIPTLFERGARLAYDYLHSLGQGMPSFPRYHRAQLWAVRWNYLKSRFTRREFNSLDLIGKLALKMGHNLSHEQTLELAWLWYQPLSECATMEAGTRELLERLRSSGLTLGLVSNTFVPGEVLDRHLRREGLLELLPIRIYSCDVRYRKPHRNIFAMALSAGGLTPQETLFVGDSPENDILGANRAGMISILKDPAGRHAHAKSKPVHSIKTLVELEGIVRQYT